ncbi:hypothetical protein [Halococcus sp. PRR34]|uniref:hypothetical protein n=1 Tax=Halococcus sp. PRR34 TaxID=3020830 RepID=UPI0023619685|nr:hypothetical protein [Halococcus sp. PRR34]
MTTIDDDVLDQLIEEYGPEIDIESKPEIISEIVDEVRPVPGEAEGLVSEHYKGGTFSKDGYTKNYIRGYAVVDEMGEEAAEFLDEAQLAIDQRMLELLREQGRPEYSRREDAE